MRDALVRTRTRYISLSRALLRQPAYRVTSGSAEAFGRYRTARCPRCSHREALERWCRLAFGHNPGTKSASS